MCLYANEGLGPGLVLRLGLLGLRLGVGVVLLGSAMGSARSSATGRGSGQGQGQRGATSTFCDKFCGISSKRFEYLDQGKIRVGSG